MLYGSQARGEGRPDSDTDVLQIVTHGGRSYSANGLNVTAYTEKRLHELAARGSLFVLHLMTDGIILSEKPRVFQRIFESYRPPATYDGLRRELALVVAALRLPGAESNLTSATKVATFVVRSLVYAACADRRIAEFDIARASTHLGHPDLGNRIRSGALSLHQLLTEADQLLRDAQVSDAEVRWATFDEAALWAGLTHPGAGALLEVVLANGSQIEYSALTLPVS